MGATTDAPGAPASPAQPDTATDASKLLQQAAVEATPGAAPADTPKGTDDGGEQDQLREVDLPEGWQETKLAKTLRQEGYEEAQSHFSKQHKRMLIVSCRI